MTRGACGGLAVGAAGALFLVVNVVLTPLLPAEGTFAETAASSLFFWRQSLASVTTLLLLGGAVALHARQADRAGLFGAVAFALAFVGTASAFAWEWSQVFVVRGVALHAPDALDALEAPDGPTPFDIGALIAVLTFTVGWLAFAVSMLFARVLPRLGPGLVIAGFLALPVLGGVVPGLWGMAAANVLIAAGWIALGAALWRQLPAGTETARRH